MKTIIAGRPLVVDRIPAPQMLRLVLLLGLTVVATGVLAPLFSAKTAAGEQRAGSELSPFSVQVAAYSQPITVAQRAAIPSQYTVVEMPYAAGVRLLVTGFEDRASAQRALAELSNAGFTDAFIRKTATNDAVVATHQHGTKTHGHTHDQLPATIANQLNTLNNEQRQRAVILDGKLHLKYGDRFEPVE